MRAPAARLLCGLSSRLATCQQAAASCGATSSSSCGASVQGVQHWEAPSFHQKFRQFSAEPAPQPADDSAEPAANDKVRRLADEIVELTILESSWLSEILRKRLNLQRPAFGGGGFPGFAPAAAAPAAAAAEAAPVEEKKEKTEFDVKLESFSPEGKIKVIKEVRVITSLGLKEAKELVEKAPVVIKAGLTRAEAEGLQKSLEAAGGKVALE